MRQALSKTIKSKWYQKLDPRSLPDFQSARIRELQKVMRRYKAEALQETLEEFPALDTLYNQSIQIQRSQRSGNDVFNNVEELLNQIN